MQPDSESRTIAIVAYLTIVGSLIAMSMNAEPRHDFGRFHTRQAFGLHLSFLGFALFLSVWFNEYAWVGLYIAYFALWLYGFLGALKGVKREVPLLGKHFQNWFKFIP